MNDYVSKPVIPDKLASAIERQIPQNQPTVILDKPEKSGDDDAKEIFDRNRLLKRIGRDEELYNALTESFLTEFDGRLEKLRESLKANDTETIALHAHTIKGLSANMEAGMMKKIAYDIETAGDKDKAILLADRLETEFKKVKAAIIADQMRE
jgi:HPt (histidine-containing phosphotransfer) domain-containing protein